MIITSRLNKKGSNLIKSFQSYINYTSSKPNAKIIKKNFGCQLHPEKIDEVKLSIINNYFNLE